MEVTEEDIFCNTVCSSEFKCDWTKWNNQPEHEFPDGTFQTCVGAQVRCGCTATMSIIRFFTYEHPSAVIVFFFVVATFLLVTVIRCVLIESYCGLICCWVREPVNQKQDIWTRSARNSAAQTDFVSENGENVESRRNSVQIYFIEAEKPPSYAYIMMQEMENLPPSYAECMQSPGRKNVGTCQCLK